MKKLLNIDGGGVRIYFSLLILNYIESKTNKNITDLFDFYSGVSASSIVLAGLLTDYSVKDIIKKFREISKIIFYKSYFYTLTSFFGIRSSKYPDHYIDSELIKLFKNNKLSDVKKPFSILTYDLINLQPKCFYSYGNKYKDDKENDYLLWKVIRGSSSPPILFTPFNLEQYTLIDGGIVTNNLSEIIFTHALDYYGIDESFFQLSIGCGFLDPDLYGVPSGLWSWSNSILNVMANASASFEMTNLKKILNINNLKHFHRVNINLSKKIKLDDCNAFSDMEIIFDKWLETNKEYLDKICDELISL
jgi:hypothetical protein